MNESSEEKEIGSQNGLSMEYWEKNAGVEFMRKIGVHPGNTVLDFGCRVGHYTIPSALAAEEQGKVFALDIDEKSLMEVTRKVKEAGLLNVEPIQGDGGVRIPLEDRSVDIVLLYDLLHMFPKEDRVALYTDLRRVLKHGGMISVFPKHTLEDNPKRHFQNMHLDDVLEEIKGGGFVLWEKHCGAVSHYDDVETGCIYNFRMAPSG